MKIKKSFYPEVDISELEYGTMNSCSWERLKPFLEQAAGLKPNEKLVGLTANEDGLKLKIEYK